MKLGIRKISIKKSLKARTTGKIKRSIKSSINPAYGKKGMGLINNPKKAVYNKIYNKTTIGINDIVSSNKSDNNKNTFYNVIDMNTVNISGKRYTKKNIKCFKNLFLIFTILSFLLVVTIPIGILTYLLYRKYKKIYNEMKDFEEEYNHF